MVSGVNHHYSSADVALERKFDDDFVMRVLLRGNETVRFERCWVKEIVDGCALVPVQKSLEGDPWQRATMPCWQPQRVNRRSREEKSFLMWRWFAEEFAYIPPQCSLSTLQGLRISESRVMVVALLQSSAKVYRKSS